MAFADRARSAAMRLGQNVGGPVTLLKVSSVYNRAPRTNTPTTTPHALVGAKTNQTLKDEQGRLIQSDKRLVIIPAASLPEGVVVAKSDKLQIGAQVYEVLSVSPEGAPPYEYRAEIQA